MKITVMGTGYVGLVAGTSLASLGNHVINADIDQKKIDKLNNGEMPIYEPGISDIVSLNRKAGRQEFTTDIPYAIKESDIIFIAVGTPQSEDGQADLKYVLSVAESIGKHMNSYKVIVDKSTVPVGTADKVIEKIKENQKESISFDVVSNPEFLREGQALHDFMQPDRVVIGTDSEKAKEMMKKVYQSLERPGKPIIYTDIKSAEMIKYASNAMLATRISFMNMLAPLCEKIGADVKTVSKGMGLDNRIGPRFLQAGIGYGGSCFPKDVQAIIHTLKENGCDSSILDAVDSINKKARIRIVEKVKEHYKENIKGITLAAWGLAFKPHTDDMREAPSVDVINELQDIGVKFRAFDPVAEETAKTMIKDVAYSSDPYDAAKDAEGIIIFTEWDSFRELDLQRVKTMMKNPVIFDGRNIYNPSDMRKMGFDYYGTGR